MPLRHARPALGADVRAAVRPVSMAGEQSLPVDAALGQLFPEGLRRGEVIGIEGPAAVSCALAVAAGPSAAGCWTIVAGLSGSGPRQRGRAGGGEPEPGASRLGVGAAAGLGVVPERLVVLAPARLDPAAWAAALTAAVDGFEVVVVRPPAGLTPGLWRRLGPRVRDRGGVLVGGDLPGGWERTTTLHTVEAAWDGVGDGSGYLRARSVTVECVGRGGASRPRRADLLLPGPGGRAALVEPAAVTAAPVDPPIRRVG